MTVRMAAQQQLRTLTSDRNLRRFVVQARPTGRQLGTGSYGTVEEVKTEIIINFKCSAHPALFIGGVERVSMRWKEDPRDSIGCWKCWRAGDCYQVCAGVPADV